MLKERVRHIQTEEKQVIRWHLIGNGAQNIIYFDTKAEDLLCTFCIYRNVYLCGGEKCCIDVLLHFPFSIFMLINYLAVIFV